MSSKDTRFLDFDTIRADLGLGTELDSFRDGWEESQRARQTDGAGFLTPPTVEEACRFLQMEPALAHAFNEALPLIAGNDALLCLAWHCHWLLFASAPEKKASLGAVPELPESLGPARDWLYAFVYLAGVPHVRELHRARGVDESVTVETLGDLALWMREYRTRFGRWGFGQAGWLTRHVSGRLYQLGRLQFETTCFPLDFHVFQNREDGEIVALTGDGLRFRHDGQFDGTNGVFDEAHAWTSFFHEDESEVRGNLVTIDGRAVHHAVDLPLDEWDCALRKGDPVLSVHIPATGPLDHAACVASYRRAMAFFPAHVPEHPFKGFYCNSWLLDCQLGEHLPESANIVRFLRDWYVLPAPNASSAQTIERVFGWDVTDPFEQPADTTLRRIVIEHMKHGERWRNAAGVIMPVDLQKIR
ncbi:MAG: DUF5596 domain-containing protein [Candidatus Hydrogenedentes bacterium]|nr:DUF5596 domain-containing protein [Candidatus Hydrogenedentota bacterium]